VVDGRVDFMRTSGSKTERNTAVGVRVLVYEAYTGALAAGAAEIGYANRLKNGSANSSAMEAIDRASEKAVGLILNTKLVTGTIVNTVSGSHPDPYEILVNKGTS